MIHADFECEFYFIRHGESVSNATPGLVAGANFDAPLTDTGYEQAQLLGNRLKREGLQFDRIYSSTLIRTVQTAETMLEAMGEPDKSFVQVEALIELQMRGWQGMPTEEVYTPEMLAYMRNKGMDFVPPDGESYRMVQRRYANWLEDEILYNEELVRDEKSLKVAIVGHGAATRSILHYIMGFDETFVWRIALDNTSITRFVFNKDGWFPICINDSTHTREAGISATSEATP